MISTLLIANRGEIACRIINSAKALGIRTVAVYSDPDANSLHLQLADEAYHIGPAPSQESYLKQDVIIAIAKQSGCQAIHPGYGFLAENADFAKACEENHLIFVGPSAHVINAMGSKSAAKKLMEDAGVPVVPGYHGAEQKPEFLLNEARKIGFPVLIKAVSGGGGKGMRVVNDEQEFLLQLASAKREALKSFGDEDVLLEKYLIAPRHIEVQILADQHKHVLHLFERDCSIQRRQQKIIEEAPAPHLDPKLRDQLTTAAVRAAEAIDYVGAGTIEFLVSGDHYYFMEMNTRLQVEHPITEKITGLDIVAWQLRIASGEALTITQQDLQCQGAAIEVRICAEDPQNEFLPATGTLTFYSPAETDPIHVRIDSGVQQGDTISMYYDSLIAKLICWAPDRATAIHHLEAALSHTLISGVNNNINYLREILRQDDYLNGDLSTGFIGKHHQALMQPTQAPACVYAYAGLYLLLSEQTHRNPWSLADAWQMNLPAQFQYAFIDNDNQRVEVNCQKMPDDHYTIIVNGESFSLQGHISDKQMTLIHGEQQWHLTLIVDADRVHVFGMSSSWVLQRFNVEQYYAAHGNTDAELLAPMPGTVVAVLTEQGAAVLQGQALMVIEAMKMEHTIHAPYDGTISEIRYRVNDQVNEGVELIVFDAVNN